MPFAYYSRLSASDKRIYRASDQVLTIALPNAKLFAPLIIAIEKSLEVGERKLVQEVLQRLSNALCAQLKVAPFKARVMATRPSSSQEELHGLYTREEGKPAVIQVWMKTSALKKVVKFRTFLRTFLHEVCHHLDYEFLKLEDSFHTEGFYARESNLMRTLAPPKPKPRKTTPTLIKPTKRTTKRAATRKKQLGLFD